jgi:hypothetical protein
MTGWEEKKAGQTRVRQGTLRIFAGPLEKIPKKLNARTSWQDRV